MNESDPGIERERPQMSAISRYYTDLRSANGSYPSIVMGIDTMLENLPFETNLNIELFQADGFLPSEQQVASSPRIANEKLALLPLEYFGSLLDISDCSVDEVRDWYDDAIKGVRSLTSRDHDMDCIVDEKTEHVSCLKSDICPQRYMERYFSGDMDNPDFSNLMYVLEPKRGYKIAYQKCNLAVKHNIVLKDYTAVLIGPYTSEYTKYFNIDLE